MPFSLPYPLSGAPTLTPMDIARLGIGGYFRDPSYRTWMQSGPQGLLDQGRDVTPMITDPRMQYGSRGQDISGGLLATGMIQRIADIIKLYGKGGLNPYTEMRDPGVGGPRGGGGGLLGSQWRDPAFIQQYEVQQGLRPGSLQPAPAPLQGGVIDASPKFAARMGAAVVERSPFGPTTAQMARPVRMTPEIAAKLQAARDARAAGQGMQLVRDAQAWLQGPGKGKLPFDSKVLSDRFNKLPSDQAEIFNRIMFPESYK